MIVRICGNFMQKKNIILISIFSIFAMLYLAFLFVLPHKIDLNKYSPQITDAIKKETGFGVDFEDLRLHSKWNSLGVSADKVDLKYPNGEKFAQIDDLQVDISVLHLLIKEIAIKKVASNQVIVRLKESAQGELELEKYVIQDKKPSARNYFKFSEKMPVIKAKKYVISFIEARTLNTYSLNGVDLSVLDFVLNKKIKIKAKGDVVLSGRKQITYDLSLFSKVFPKDNGQKIDFIKTFKDLYRYNVNANVIADLSIKPNDKSFDINGNTIIDKIFFTLDGKTFPKSDLKLDFKGNQVKINSDFYTELNSKAFITGIFRPGKFIDLKVLTDDIKLENAVLIANNLLKLFGKKSLDSIQANGILKADFNIKSDLKKIQSSGYLRVKGANIVDKISKMAFKSVNADVDFSQDMVNIHQASAFFNNQPIIIRGKIDKFANADISVVADNLQLKGAILALGSGEILKENDITGMLNANIALKGRLDKIVPRIKILISDINLKNKKSKIQTKIALVDVNSQNTNNAKIQISGVKVFTDFSSKISIPKILMSYDKNDLTIEKTYFYIDNIKANIEGKILDLDSKPTFSGLNLTIPSQNAPIQGYAGSNINLNGKFNVQGSVSNPVIKGGVNVPIANLPSISTYLKNLVIVYGGSDVIDVKAEYLLIANSLMSFSAQLNNDFSKGIVAKNVDFKARNLDLYPLSQAFKSLPKNQGADFTILNGKSYVEHFKVSDIVASEINSNLSFKNNVLCLKNLTGEAYSGKIAGDINYNLLNTRVELNLQGRGLSANPAIMAITKRNDDINGKLDFDSDISLAGASKRDILNSLKGNVNFIISNGKMSVLGKFEHLLYAQNILSNSVFKATLNVIAKAISVKNTGVYRYMKGKVSFSNGWANIGWIKTSGPSMSLYMVGRYNLMMNSASLTMLGRISDDIVRILGPIGEFSMDKVISTIPKIGEVTPALTSQFTVNPDYEDVSLIPPLFPQTEFKTKAFKVIIDGDIQKQSSVKSFKWISSPKVVQPLPKPIPLKQEPAQLPDFINKLPDLR